jgi:DNA primase
MTERNAELQEAIDTLDIEAWLDREGVRYKAARGARGRQLNIKECPCCGNSNYKVYLNADTGLGNCFSGDCEEKFNKWKFISKYLNTTHRAAIDHIKQVAKEQGWRPPKKESAAVSLAGELKLPNSLALPIDGRNLKYLDNRNITADVAKYFNLRFSLRGTFDYHDDRGRPMRQDYSSRIIIPVFDLAGELVSFQGRDITGTADKKYLFPPGFASTGSHLYNGHNVVGLDSICIGEGAFDVAAIKIAFDGEMALREVGAVGSFGKHLSIGDEESQLAKLMALREKGLKRVTFMWDGEDRAIDDAIEAGLLLHKCGFQARIAILPKDKDPNEVPPSVVRAAYWRAEVVNASVAARMRLMKRVA